MKGAACARPAGMRAGWGRGWRPATGVRGGRRRPATRGIVAYARPRRAPRDGWKDGAPSARWPRRGEVRQQVKRPREARRRPVVADPRGEAMRGWAEASVRAEGETRCGGTGSRRDRVGPGGWRKRPGCRPRRASRRSRRHPTGTRRPSSGSGRSGWTGGSSRSSRRSRPGDRASCRGSPVRSRRSAASELREQGHCTIDVSIPHENGMTRSGHLGLVPIIGRLKPKLLSQPKLVSGVMPPFWRHRNR